MLYVNVSVSFLGRKVTIAVPRKYVGYIATWDGNNWIAQGTMSATALLCLDGSFVVR